jgi:hypothetical protein
MFFWDGGYILRPRPAEPPAGRPAGGHYYCDQGSFHAQTYVVA